MREWYEYVNSICKKIKVKCTWNEHLPGVCPVQGLIEMHDDPIMIFLPHSTIIKMLHDIYYCWIFKKHVGWHVAIRQRIVAM